ncbi:MAG: HEAT repeat domain-containing protein [Planctomycetaceae bacterium]
MNLLARFGTRAHPAVPALLRVVCSDSDTQLRNQAASALASIGTLDPTVYQALEGGLRNPWTVASHARALKSLGAVDPMLVRSLLEDLETSHGVTAHALAQLEQLR